jgi:predicted MFS family arabinose efflux permease
MALNVSGLSLGRALGAFTGARLYGLGFGWVAAGAVFFNLVALFAVSRLGKKHS